jgi:U4/U6.U5 tri-snRNP-associated protein 3
MLVAAPPRILSPEEQAALDAANAEKDNAKKAKMEKLRQMVSEKVEAKPLVQEEPAAADDGDAMEDADEDEDESAAMARLMGFSGFDTTKNKAVEDNFTSAAKGSASVKKARKYRQYMNRKGGFNRPLEKMG